MKRETLKLALQNYYTNDTINALLIGKRTPQLKKALELEDRFGIPVQAWRDIKSYLKEHSNKTTENNSNMKTTKKVS